MDTLVISEGAPPLQLDLFTTRSGLRKVDFRPSTSFCCRFVEGDPIEEIVTFLKSYAKGEPILLNFPLDWAGIKGLRKQGLEEILKVSWGKTRSYGEIASSLGSKHLARAVGAICGANPWPLFIPCHRVVATNKKLGGYAYGLELKRLLLDFEGAAI